MIFSAIRLDTRAHTADRGALGHRVDKRPYGLRRPTNRVEPDRHSELPDQLVQGGLPPRGQDAEFGDQPTGLFLQSGHDAQTLRDRGRTGTIGGTRLGEARDPWTLTFRHPAGAVTGG